MQRSNAKKEDSSNLYQIGSYKTSSRKFKSLVSLSGMKEASTAEKYITRVRIFVMVSNECILSTIQLLRRKIKKPILSISSNVTCLMLSQSHMPNQ